MESWCQGCRNVACCAIGAVKIELVSCYVPRGKFKVLQMLLANHKAGKFCLCQAA